MQTKKQDKTPEEQLSEMEIDNLSPKEFRDDNKDDLRSWKTMETQAKKIQEMFNSM